MPGSLAISLIRSLDSMPGDVGVLTVNGSVQPDRIMLADIARPRNGYGYGSGVATGYGFGRGPRYGNGVYGAGWYGQGTEAMTITTQTSFPAGDYSVQVRAVDAAGNASAYSASVVVAHRPTPDAPANLQVAAGKLTWTWTKR